MTLLEFILWILSICSEVAMGYGIYVTIGPTYLFIPIILTPFIFIVWFALWILLITLWGFTFDKKKEPKFSKFYYAILVATDTLFLRIIRVHIHLNGKEKLPKDRRYLIVSNHVSNFDHMTLLAAFRKEEYPLLAITKPENMDFPIAGPLIHHSGFIPINRENAKEGIKAIIKGANYLKSGTLNIAICPEGTRNKTEELLLPFHPGSFKLAEWGKAPIVIICFRGTKEIAKLVPWHKAIVNIDILEAINPEDYEGKNTTELAKHAEEIIIDHLKEENR